MASSTKALVAATLAALMGLQPRPTLIDGFESTNGWTVRATEGVGLRAFPDSGFRGRAMRLDFDFGPGIGAAGVRRAANITLPANFELAFRVRGEGAVGSLELRLTDQDGAVWASSRDGFDLPRDWTEIVLRKRRFTPLAATHSAPLARTSAIELVLHGVPGGTGRFWIDDLQLRPRGLDQPYTLTPQLVASSEGPGFEARRAMDGDSSSFWRWTAGDTARPPQPANRGKRAPVQPTMPADGSPTLVIDFQVPRELGGLIIDWEPGHRAAAYAVDVSVNGRDWTTGYRASAAAGARDHVPLPESEARFVRLVMARGSADEYGIREIAVAPVEWSASTDAFFAGVAKDAPRGSFPEYLNGTQPSWTVAGVDGGGPGVRVSAAGMVESAHAGVSVEPFVYIDGRLFTRHDVTITHSLGGAHFPEPSVVWDGGDWTLTLAPVVVSGPPDSAVAYLQYRLMSRSRAARAVRLYLAVRPFRVAPPWQSAGAPGGVSTIRDLSGANQVVQVNGEPAVVSLTPAAAFGAAAFEQGDIVEYLRRGQLPPVPNVHDPFGHASGALAYSADVDSGSAAVVEVALPVHGASVPAAIAQRDLGLRAPRDRAADVRRAWRDAVERTTIELPPSASRVVHTLYASLGYILVTRDHAALGVGSDGDGQSRVSTGALEAAALLRLGRSDVAREFLEWYARHQLGNGYVPCCVGPRGADLVPEHDSHGAFISLAAEYWRHTRDRAVADAMWPNVIRAAVYIDSLRRQQRTPAYEAAEKRVLYGMLPPSASRSLDVSPTHSYRDDFAALRGLKDAAELAHALSRPEEPQLVAARDELRRDLYASVQLAMVQRRIDFLPDSPERGEPDPLGAIRAVAPNGERESMPETIAHAVDRTLARYGAAPGTDAPGQGDAYAAGEVRAVQALVRLGQRDRAHVLLDHFLDAQRPAGWYQWPDMVQRDSPLPVTHGGMPSTTAAAEFISAALDMFAYERESDSTLVIGAGVPERWVSERPGVTVRRLSTYYGMLSYTMRRENTGVRISMQAGLRIPPGGIVVHSPFAGPAQQAVVNGAATPLTSTGAVVVRSLPAEVVFRR